MERRRILGCDGIKWPECFEELKWGWVDLKRNIERTDYLIIQHLREFERVHHVCLQTVMLGDLIPSLILRLIDGLPPPQIHRDLIPSVIRELSNHFE